MGKIDQVALEEDQRAIGKPLQKIPRKGGVTDMIA